MNKGGSHMFYSQLLEDIDVLKSMIHDGKFEKRLPFLGAEQELCLIDDYGQVAKKNEEILRILNDNSVTTELAKFNLEINLSPRPIYGEVFSDVELELIDYLDRINEAAKKYNAKTYLGGILPTLRYLDIDLESMTPRKRYYELVQNILKKRGGEYEIRIQGEDELLIKQDSVFIEAATTSFQVHLEVHPDNFVQYYNISQLIAAPILSLAANSNILFQKKLWHETRVALLQQSIHTGKTPVNTRETISRVGFGKKWLRSSIVELFQEDITTHKLLLTPEISECSRDIYQEGKVPALHALSNFNSTVYRWNRPVYGMVDGKPHLRIENRILPSGPTVADQIANAVFWYGSIYGMAEEITDFESKMDFRTAKSNFIQAARNSMHASFEWLDGRSYTAQDLILHKLLPIAANGLAKLRIDQTDIDFYLNIISERCKYKTNGAIWMYRSMKSLEKQNVLPVDISGSIAIFSHEMQSQNLPLHQWEVLSQNINMKKTTQEILIEECMDRELYTVGPDDPIQLATDLIDWQKIRYILVEDEQKNLLGMVSSRNLLKSIQRHLYHQDTMPEFIHQVMIGDPYTIASDRPLSEALEIMKNYRIGCLPVTEKNKLVGIITEQTFLNEFSNMIKSNN